LAKASKASSTVVEEKNQAEKQPLETKVDSSPVESKELSFKGLTVSEMASALGKRMKAEGKGLFAPGVRDKAIAAGKVASAKRRETREKWEILRQFAALKGYTGTLDDYEEAVIGFVFANKLTYSVVGLKEDGSKDVASIGGAK